jgi:cyclase
MKKIFFLAIGLNVIVASAQNFVTKDFEIKKLAPNVYAAFARNGGYAICNSGIIDLGQEVVVFDPFLTPQAASDLKRFVQTHIGKPVKYVVNSHFHKDHIRGNQVFENATIIGTPLMAELILKNEPAEIENEGVYGPGRLRYYDSIPHAKDPWQASEDSIKSGFFRGIVVSHPTLKTVPPSLLFSDSLSIVGTNTTVKLITYGDGHSPSDVFLYLPKEKIAFMGDLVLVQNHPMIGDSKPADWINYLKKVQQLDVKTFIPGHGPAGNAVDVSAVVQYLENVRRIAAEFKGQEPTDEAILAKMPSEYSSWHLRDFFTFDVKYMLKQ